MYCHALTQCVQSVLCNEYRSNGPSPPWYTVTKQRMYRLYRCNEYFGIGSTDSVLYCNCTDWNDYTKVPIIPTTNMDASSGTSELVDVSDVVDKLAQLQLFIIPQDYVDQVMESQYSYHTFPESYETIVMPDINFVSIVNSSCEILNRYLQQPTVHILWDQFINDDSCCVQPKYLSCLINCYIQHGIKDMQNPLARKNGLTAVRLFFSACLFNDSQTNGFYHAFIFNKCFELLKFCIPMLHSDDIQLNEEEKCDLLLDLLNIVRGVGIMVKRFQFVDEINSLDLIIEIMIDITRLERKKNILEKLPTEMLSYGTLAFNAYSSLMAMFNNNCGSTYKIGQKLMYYLLSGLLVDEQSYLQLITREFNVIRDHHLSFIQKLIEKLGTSFDCLLEILLQHLLHRVPNHKELKNRQLIVIMAVWKLCPNDVRIKTKYYLLRMVYAEDTKIRIVALETLFSVLSEPEEVEPEDSDLLPLMPATKHEFIAAVILSKFQDSSITVRAKAFSLFAILTAGSPTATIHQTNLIKRMFVDPYLNVDNLNESPYCNKDFHNFHQYLENNMANFNANNIINSNIYPGAKTLLWVLNVHSRDKQSNIRRLSLTLLCNLFLINNKFIEKDYLSLLEHGCFDCLLSVRKVAVSGLTDMILKYADNENILNYWFKGLIYLVGDRDKTIQNLAVECFNRVILKNIKPYSTKIIGINDSLDYLPWRVLDYALNAKVGKYMMCLCKRWRINGILTDRIVNDLMTFVSAYKHKWTVHSLYLLQLISHQLEIKNISQIVWYFDTHFDSWFSNEIGSVELNESLTSAQVIIDILVLNYKNLDKGTKQRLLNEFEGLLFNFNVPIRLISKSLDLYTVLQSDDLNKCNTNLKKLFQIICTSIEKTTNMNNDEIMLRYICTLGDIGLVQHLQIERTLQNYLLNFLGNNDRNISSAFQAIVVLTIGKLSIVDEQFAKESIVNFRSILRNAYHPSIKINALTALADLFSCFTTLVEPVIPDMCVCLKADSLSVKRVALELLIGLILKDYLRLKDTVFFALLCMLEDTDIQVRQETESFIINYVLIKNKDIMEQKIIEVIFYLNGYKERFSGEEYCTNNEIKVFFSTEGDSKKNLRHYVYIFMLKNLLDANKLKLMVKIFNILGRIVNDVRITTDNTVKECVVQVVRDAFWILRAKEMALTSGKPRDSNDDDPETLVQVADLAKKKLVMETYRKVMTEYIIPGVLSLKYELNKKRIFSTVMNDFYAYLCTLTSRKSSLKEEIFKLLSVDCELSAEIVHEQMKRHKHQPGNENESEEDDDDHNNNNVNINFIQDLEYVTWAQINEIRDKAEEVKSIQVQMQEELQQKVPEIFVQENNSQEVDNISQKSISVRYSTADDDDDLPGYGLFD